MKARQKKLDEVRVQIPYFRVRVWKEIPMGRVEALEKLEEIMTELMISLSRVEKQRTKLGDAEARDTN